MKDEYDFSQGKRGAVEPVSPGKTRITIRIDDDVLGMVSRFSSPARWRQLPNTD